MPGRASSPCGCSTSRPIGRSNSLALQADLRVVRKGAAYLITSREHADGLFQEEMEKERAKIELDKFRKMPPPRPEAPPPQPHPGPTGILKFELVPQLKPRSSSPTRRAGSVSDRSMSRRPVAEFPAAVASRSQLSARFTRLIEWRPKSVHRSRSTPIDLQEPSDAQ